MHARAATATATATHARTWERACTRTHCAFVLHARTRGLLTPLRHAGPCRCYTRSRLFSHHPKRKVAARRSAEHTPLFAESTNTASHSAALRRVHPSPLPRSLASNLQTGLLSHIMWYEIGSHSEK